MSPADPYTIIYTSGTTGRPKGVVLSHGNCASVGVMVEEIGFINDEELSYLYLPLAHSFALTVQLASFDVGTAIVYFGGDTQQIVAELMQVKPTYVPSVPRIFEKIYALALAMADDEQQLRDAVELGVKVRQMRERGEDVPDETGRRRSTAPRRPCTERSAACSAAASTSAYRAPPRSPPRSSSSSTPAG